jgi:hypothetical protein
VIIDDFNVVCIPSQPDEANAELVVDANAVLAFSVAQERFKMVAWGCFEVKEFNGAANDEKLLQSSLAKIRRDASALSCLPQ